jgi:hypothetical protein
MLRPRPVVVLLRTAVASVVLLLRTALPSIVLLLRTALPSIVLLLRTSVPSIVLLLRTSVPSVVLLLRTSSASVVLLLRASSASVVLLLRTSVPSVVLLLRTPTLVDDARALVGGRRSAGRKKIRRELTANVGPPDLARITAPRPETRIDARKMPKDVPRVPKEKRFRIAVVRRRNDLRKIYDRGTAGTPEHIVR